MEKIRESITEINNRSPVVNEVAIAKSTIDGNIYYLFRDNNMEIEIDIKLKIVSEQLTIKEFHFLESYFPYIELKRFKIRTKKYL